MGLWRDELRNAVGVGRPYQLMDAAGAALGAYFMIDAWARRREGRAMVNLALGAVMFYVHAARFIEGSKVSACDLCERERAG